MLTNDALAYTEENAERSLSLLLALARIPAPSGMEDARAEYCRDYLVSLGAKGVYIDSAKNVIYPIGCEGSCPIAVVMAHSDVVFPDTEPLPIRREGERLVGPGIGDDTANVAALLHAAAYVTERGLVPTGMGVLLVINASEEGLGNLRGTREIFRAYGTRIREMVSLDGANASLVVRAVGSIRYRVSVKTEGGHSYGAFGSRNAIAELSRIVGELYAYRVPEKGKTTYNVGTVSGGTSVNTIAEDAEMLFELRSDERESLAEARANFEAVIRRARERGLSVEVETVGERPCMGEVDPGEMERMALRAERILLTHYGDRTESVTRRSGSTDCNVPLSLGIPSVCYGCYFGGGAHTRAEWLEISSLRPGLNVALETVLAYF